MLWSINWYIEVYGIYNEAIFIVYLKLLIKILCLLCCIKKTDISNMLESGVLKEILYDWRKAQYEFERKTALLQKENTACLEECSIFCRGTVSWTKSYFVWKENCSLWMKVIFFKHGKERCNFKTDCFRQEIMCFLTWVCAHLFWK